MWPLLLLLLAAGDVWSVNTSVGPSETKSFASKHLEAGQHYTLVTRGHCTTRGSGRTRRWRENVNPGRDTPFGTEYKVFVGRLEFTVGVEEQNIEFMADSTNPTVRVEDRSSPTTSLKCALTSISVRAP